MIPVHKRDSLPRRNRHDKNRIEGLQGNVLVVRNKLALLKNAYTSNEQRYLGIYFLESSEE